MAINSGIKSNKSVLHFASPNHIFSDGAADDVDGGAVIPPVISVDRLYPRDRKVNRDGLTGRARCPSDAQ